MKQFDYFKREVKSLSRFQYPVEKIDVHPITLEQAKRILEYSTTEFTKFFVVDIADNVHPVNPYTSILFTIIDNDYKAKAVFEYWPEKKSLLIIPFKERENIINYIETKEAERVEKWEDQIKYIKD